MYVDFSDLLGKILYKVKHNNDVLSFHSDENIWRMFHSQECCESVYVEDIVGDLADLVGSPIVRAEERSQADQGEGDGIGMWTFYEIATNRGSVTIRWYGSSNGYYSVTVSVSREDYHTTAHERIQELSGK